MALTNDLLEPKKKQFIEDDFNAKKWRHVKKEFKKLMNLPINSKDDLLTLIEHYSEIYSVLEESTILKGVKVAGYSNKKKYLWDIIKFGVRILGRAYLKRKKFYKYIYNSQYFSELPEQLQKIISNVVEFHSKKNLLLSIKEYYKVWRYAQKMSKLTTEFKGETKTLTQLNAYLTSQDRSLREEAWKAYHGRLLREKEKLDKTFNKMKKNRIKQAKNLGFQNYRDMVHKRKKRYDYSPDDCFEFHDAVEKVVVPYVKELNEYRKKRLNVETLRPWDKDVDLDDKDLKPYENGEEFIEKMIKIFHAVKPEYGIHLNMMKNSGFLDLENRKNKMSGGFTAPLSNRSSSFILINGVGLHKDVITLAHEGGHSMHAYKTADLKYGMYRDYTMELAEVASMSMELLAMEHFGEYYASDDDLRKAKIQSLENGVRFLPWCMIVDAFQQWIYLNPNHANEQRQQFFLSLINRFDTSTGIDYSGIEDLINVRWMRQSHIYQSPFYYIEYGIAQLGAFAIYKNYKENGKKTIKQYNDFLSLGYSKGLKEVFKAGGIKFDFSEEYLSELINFIKEEIEMLRST